MTKQPLFLLTNDDGIQSPGLWAAVRAVKSLGQVLVVAPAHQQTAAGRSFRGNQDARLEPFAMTIEGQAIEAYALEASPACVVRHGIQVLCQDRLPDMVISGINYGENVGTSISASGTVGAALEAACMGIPSMAVSKQIHPDGFFHHGEEDWSASAFFLHHFAQKRMGKNLPTDVDLLKIDIPSGATHQSSWRLTRLSRHPYIAKHLPNPGLHSRLGDGKITVEFHPEHLEAGTDVHALVVDKVVSVTPLSLDATSRTDFDTLHRCLS